MSQTVDRADSETLSEFARNVRWTEEHWADLLAMYSDQFIVVYDQRVVAFAPNQDELFPPTLLRIFW